MKKFFSEGESQLAFMRTNLKQLLAQISLAESQVNCREQRSLSLNFHTEKEIFRGSLSSDIPQLGGGFGRASLPLARL